jgi:inosose dehydratase
MRLAYQTNTWGGVVGHPAGVTSVKDLYYLTNGSTEEALEDIAAAGYTGFEIFDGNLMQYAGREDEFRQQLERLGLTFVGVYSGANFIFEEILEEELAKIESAAELAARLGAEHLVVGGGAVRTRGIHEEDYRRLGAGLERVVELAGRTGLVPSFHPHLGTMAVSPEQIAKVFEYTSINFCPDTAHLQAGGGDPLELIRAYSDRIRYVHLKDYQDGQFLPLGGGTQDLDGIVQALQELKYDGWILVELDSFDGPPIEGARISKAFLDARLA